MFIKIICTFVVILLSLNESFCQIPNVDTASFGLDAGFNEGPFTLDPLLGNENIDGSINNEEIDNAVLNNDEPTYEGSNYDDGNVEENANEGQNNEDFGDQAQSDNEHDIDEVGNERLPNEEQNFENIAYNELPNDSINLEEVNNEVEEPEANYEEPNYADQIDANDGLNNEVSNIEEPNYEEIGNEETNIEGVEVENPNEGELVNDQIENEANDNLGAQNEVADYEALPSEDLNAQELEPENSDIREEVYTPNYEPPQYDDVNNDALPSEDLNLNQEPQNENSYNEEVPNPELNNEDLNLNQEPQNENSYNEEVPNPELNNEELQYEYLQNDMHHNEEPQDEPQDIDFGDTEIQNEATNYDEQPQPQETEIVQAVQPDDGTVGAFENSMTNANALSINLPGIGPVPSMGMSGAMSGSMFQHIGGTKNMSTWKQNALPHGKMLGNAESNANVGKDGTSIAQTSAGFGENKVSSSALADPKSAYGESVAEIGDEKAALLLSDRSATDQESNLSIHGPNLNLQQRHLPRGAGRRHRNKMSYNPKQFMPNPKDFREVNFEEHHDKKFNMKAK